MKTSYTRDFQSVMVTFDIDGHIQFEFLNVIELSRKITFYSTQNGFHAIAYAKNEKSKKALESWSKVLQDNKKTYYDNKSKNPKANKRLFTEKHEINERIIK